MDKLLVISSYPAAGSIHYTKTVGIASYAKNTLLGISENIPNMDILVLAEKLKDEPDSYKEKNIYVKRVWKRGSFSIFPDLLNEISKQKSYTKILFEFEISMFGNPVITAPLVLFLIFLRLLGKETTIVLHQAITNLSEFEGHTNIKGFKSILLSFMLKTFYKIIILISRNVIVFEQSLKERLGNSSKISVIPHGVQSFKALSKSEAREKLKISKSKKVVLLFGYIAWYKGTDWVVNEFKKLRENKEFNNYLLIVAGGPNPNHNNKDFYNKYIDGIKSSNDENILYTGFVKENDIATYFECSDLVILPYRAFMSASGPLSIAYSFEKPAFVSKELKVIFNNQDISRIMKEINILSDDLTFNLDSNDFTNLLRNSKNEILKKSAELSSLLKEERGFKNIGKKYLDLIFNNEK